MQPDKTKVVIDNTLDKISELLMELVLMPRIDLIKWSKITKQTPNIRIGYPGQHLSSLITGVVGEGSGARGNDLSDGSEVKSCSRIDQLDKCMSCNSPVSRLETVCSVCSSEQVKRNNDSKWLFSVRSTDELDLLTKRLPRILLMLADYPEFAEGNFSKLRFQAFEIWPNHPRNSRFSEIITNYYEKIYLEHKKNRPNSNPAPKNFWPYQFQFYMCNPIQTFQCTVEGADSNPKINIDNYISPEKPREKEKSVDMPSYILSEQEFETIISKASEEELNRCLTNPESKKVLLNLPLAEKRKLFVGINETLRSYLTLRDTDKISVSKTPYRRREFS